MIIGMNKNLITYEGKTLKKVKADFESGIDLYLESCKYRNFYLLQKQFTPFFSDN